MRDIARGLTIAFVLKVFGAGLLFLLNVVVARLLGADGAGIYFLSLSIVTLASVISRFGLDNAMLRFVSTNAAAEDWGAVAATYTHGLRIAITLSSAVTLALFAAAETISLYGFQKPGLTFPLRIMSLSILPFTVLTIHAEILKGISRIAFAMCVQGIGIPLISLLIIYPLALSHGLLGASAVYSIATAVVAVLAVYSWRMSIAGRSGGTSERVFSRSALMESCRSLFFVSLIGKGVLPNAPAMLIGYWLSSDDVGVFAAAQRLALLVGFLLSTVNSVVTPKFANLYVREQFKQLESTARKTTLMIAAVASPLFVALVCFSEQLMAVYGPEFKDGAMVLSILAVGQFINILSGSVGQILIISGRESILRNLTVFAALLLLALNSLLIPVLGLPGAALSSALSLAFLSLSATFMVKKKLNIRIIF